VTVGSHDHPDLEANLEELATAVLGPRRSEFVGGGRYEENGLVHKVDQLLMNGLKVKFGWKIWTAIIAALGGLGVQLIQTLGD
jgi:hypothetical protein